MKIIDFKDARCRHCYKCVRHCNVKAIAIKNRQAHIMEYHCIHCGHCLEACPQNAKTFASDLERVQSYIRRGMQVIISMAPSYLSVLGYEHPGQVVDAILRLGFSQVRETSEGAAYVTREYARLIEEGIMDNIITTCCPSMNDLIEKYYPSLVPWMAPVVSPMIAHGRIIKDMYGKDTRVVFLGPCIAKKEEARGDERVAGSVDAIITFEELEGWLEKEGIKIKECGIKPVSNPSPGTNRFYSVRGGVIQSVMEECAPKGPYRRIFEDGLESCMELLDSMTRGELHGCFLELNVCEGGCVKGPASGKKREPFVKAKLKVEEQVGHVREECGERPPDFVPMEKLFQDRHMKDPLPEPEKLEELLRKMGKYNLSDELNCGACGYATCREKAIAVFQKKAEMDMCLPYAVTQAESMANVILDTTPDFIFVVNQKLRVIECNRSVQRKFGISHDDALRKYIFEFVDDDGVEQVLTTKKNILHKKTAIKSLGLRMRQTIVYMEERDCVLAVYKDVTRETQLKEQHFKLKMETVDMAQEVIDKQMMVAQEIAGLLGETTAETKVTLSKLRDTILAEED